MGLKTIIGIIISKFSGNKNLLAQDPYAKKVESVIEIFLVSAPKCKGGKVC